ncbi:MAG TPA: TSUP family transporter [Actinomycetales bacterium]|nr:TSUP family transporter [Actinomycetales bacterium]
MPELELPIILLVVVGGFVAGWVDAVVGGGGLIQLPVLLLVPGLAPVQALATNKMGSIMGTSVAAYTYQRKIRTDLTTALPMAAAALLGALGGAALAAQIPGEALRPIVVAACALVFLWIVFRRASGLETVRRYPGRRHHVFAVLIGLVIGAYDGLLGPGTGTFLVIALVGVLGYAFMPASAIAKIVNFATNLGALIFFVPAGHVVWQLGLMVGAANMLGGFLGARTAVARGSEFVRVVFLVVVAGLIVKLVWDMIAA